MYYPEGIKARVSPVQLIEPHRILATTRDSNQEPPGPQSIVATTILPLHTELLYADDLVLIAETKELLFEKVRNWKKGMEKKGLRVNAGKTKIMWCRLSLSHICVNMK